MEFEKYRLYKTEDFILDPGFKEKVMGNGQKDGQNFVRELIYYFPDKEIEILKAVKIVQGLDRHYQNQLPSPEDRAQVFRELQERKNAILSRKNGRIRKMRWALAIAASVLFIFLVWRYEPALFVGSSERVCRTLPGEITEYRLPDGSTVTLNGNSKLVIPKRWGRQSAREVWLEGEAYFRVRSREGGQSVFIVHTIGPDIEVLGTQFNVDTRSSKTQVVLEEGTIQLKLQSSSTRFSDPLVMKKGQLVEYTAKEGYRVVNDVNPVVHRTWIENYLLMDEMSTQEIITKIEALYDITILVKNDSILQGHYNGVLPTSNLEELQQTLETLFNSKITRSNNVLILN